MTYHKGRYDTQNSTVNDYPKPTFSARNGLGQQPIRFRTELSDALRQPIFNILRESAGTRVLEESVVRVLNLYGLTPPAAREGEIELSEAEVKAQFERVKRVLLESEWFRLYDVIEDVFDQLAFYEQELAPEDEEPRTPSLRRSLNTYFVNAGIGWRIVDGRFVTRGTETLDAIASSAHDTLTARWPTAARHVHDAVQALSRRPTADHSGAIYHAMGALECVARELVGDQKATLGEILKRRPTLLPSPLGLALSQIWGFASNEARHVVEGRDPTRDDAELVVGLAATVATYLTRRTFA